MKTVMGIALLVLSSLLMVSSSSAQTTIFTEEFETGTDGQPVVGYISGWSGDTNILVSSTPIAAGKGKCARWSSGTPDWPCIEKEFSYTPSYREQYELTATLQAADAGDYAQVTLATSSSNYVCAAMDANAEGGHRIIFEANSYSYQVITSAPADTMDVKLVVTGYSQMLYCYYRQTGASTWIPCGFLPTGTTLADYNHVEATGHTQGYDGAMDSIALTATTDLPYTNTLVTEYFNGTAPNPVNGNNGWTGSDLVVYSDTTIDHGNSAGWASGSGWPVITKTFSHNPTDNELYVLSAVLNAPNSSGDYAEVRLRTASDVVTSEIEADLGYGYLTFSADNNTSGWIRVAPSSATMDVKVVCTPDNKAHCFYRNHNPVATTVLFQEDFNGTAPNPVNTLSGWTGDSTILISDTEIISGNCADVSGGGCVTKTFSYTPDAGEQYELAATLYTPDYGSTNGYTEVDIAAASGNAVAAYIYGDYLSFSDGTHVLHVAPAATMDVKMVFTSDQKTYCYYRTENGNYDGPWSYAGCLTTGFALSAYDRIKIYGWAPKTGKVDYFRLVSLPFPWTYAGVLTTGSALSAYDRVQVAGHANYDGNVDSIMLGTQTSFSHGRQVIYNQGLQILAEACFASTPTNDEITDWGDSEFTTLFFGNPGQSPATLEAIETLWVQYYLEKEPGKPYGYLSSYQLPYVNDLVGLMYGDEYWDIMTPARQVDMAATYRAWNALYPNALAYTNNFTPDNGPPYSVADLVNYMQNTKPDMLMFDRYPKIDSFNDVDNHDGEKHDWYNAMQMYRTAALQGYDGSGLQPIPDGQWLNLYRDSYTADLPSESYICLQQFASWAFGYTCLAGYLYNESGSGYKPVMFDANGTRTPVFGYVATANQQSANLGSALIRLKSSDIRMVPGKNPIYDHFEVPATDVNTTRWTSTGTPTVLNTVVTLSNYGSLTSTATGWSSDTYSFKLASEPTGGTVQFGLHNDNGNGIALIKNGSTWKFSVRKNGGDWWESNTITVADSDLFEFEWSSGTSATLYRTPNGGSRTLAASCSGQDGLDHVPTTAMYAHMYGGNSSTLYVNYVAKAGGIVQLVPASMASWDSGNFNTGGYTDYITSITPRGANNEDAPSSYCDWLVGYLVPLWSDDYSYAEGLHFMIVNGSPGKPFAYDDQNGDPASNSAQYVRISFDFSNSGYNCLQRLSRTSGSTEIVPNGSGGSEGWYHDTGSQYHLILKPDGGTGDLFRFYTQ